jgi:hypothetical protein
MRYNVRCFLSVFYRVSLLGEILALNLNYQRIAPEGRLKKGTCGVRWLVSKKGFQR